jgi:hypothetical protein
MNTRIGKFVVLYETDILAFGDISSVSAIRQKKFKTVFLRVNKNLMVVNFLTGKETPAAFT